MSIETLSPLPVTAFGSWVTLLDPSSVPPGMSPSLGDVDFFPGGVRTRAGLVSELAGIAGSPQINGLKTYITPSLSKYCLVFDSLGNLYKEFSPGSVTPISGPAISANLYMASSTHFGREYMAFGDGTTGKGMPLQYDNTNLDRVSQIGPAEGPSVADAVTSGTISPGTHQCAVVFVTRQGFWTAPSPPVSWAAAGAHAASVTDIPTGPSNVVARLLTFTAAGGASFYHIPSTMVINDNTTTSLTVDFTESVLLSGQSIDSLFSQIELPEQLGVIDYAERLFWWGERARMDNWRNLSFDGGWDPSGNGRPFGWGLDPGFGAGAGREASNVVWGDAYKITGDGTSLVRGLIQQGAITDASGDPLLLPNVDYSVRARIARSSDLSQGILRINAYSPTLGQVGPGMSITYSQAGTAYQEFTAQLFSPQLGLPSDLSLRVYADGTASPSGAFFLVDNIEIYQTNQPLNGTIVRASGTEEPESFDGVTGFMNIAANNGEGIRAAFTLRNNLYFVKERSLFVTATDGVNEPSQWTVEEVSNHVGTSSAHGVGVGEEWVVIVGRSGLYLFDGSEPVKLSQEIQPTWDTINWAYGHLLWVTVDTQRKKILVGVPMGSATQPNQVLVLDYSEGLGDPLLNLIGAPERSRKWVPWTISANSCAQIERSTGVAQIFLGSNNGTGKVYGLTPGQLSDDGASINSFYTTGFLTATGPSARSLFGYLTAYVQGSGTLALAAYFPGDTALTTIGSWSLATPAAKDAEQMTNLLGERVSYQFGTNAVGSWFSLTKLVPWAKPDPFAIIRGVN